MTTLMASIPTIVYLTEADPFDQSQGASIKSIATIKKLCQHNRVHVLYVRRTPAAVSHHSSTKKINNLTIESVYIPDIDTPIKKRLFWLLCNYLLLKPHHFAAYASQRYAQSVLQAVQKHRPIFIWADHIRMAQYWDSHQAIPLIIETHNIEWKLLYDCFVIAPKLGKWHFLIWFIEAMLTKRKERYYFSKASKILAISPSDAKSILKLNHHSKIALCPPLLSEADLSNALAQYQEKTAAPTNRISLLFIGNLNWFPNADALNYFLVSIWPMLVQTLPNVELHVVGQPSSIYDFQTLIAQQKLQTVFLHGKQPHLQQFYRQADVVILPFRVGGGIRIKALEALQQQKTIVTTSVGVSGLPTTELATSIPWLLADDPASFVKQIKSLKNKHRFQQNKASEHYYKAYCKWAVTQSDAALMFTQQDE